jgi:hypothetical protein
MRFKNVGVVISVDLSNQNVNQRFIRLNIKDNLHNIRYPNMGASEKPDSSLPGHI